MNGNADGALVGSAGDGVRMNRLDSGQHQTQHDADKRYPEAQTRYLELASMHQLRWAERKAKYSTTTEAAARKPGHGPCYFRANRSRKALKNLHNRTFTILIHSACQSRKTDNWIR
jgi:hypothetical protein